MRRTVITILAVVFAGFVMWAMVQSQSGPTATDGEPETAPEPTPAQQQQQQEADREPDAQPAADGDTAEAPPAPAAPAEAEGQTGPTVPQDLEPIEGLGVQPVEQPQPDPTLGSAEKDSEYLSQVRITPYGAGLKRVALSHYSASLDEHVPYPVQRRLPDDRVGTSEDGEPIYNYRYPMAAYNVRVNGGDPVYLLNQRWELVEEDEESAAFELSLVDGEGEPVLRIRRTWRIQPGSYEVMLRQRLENLSGEPLRVQFSQYGPGDMQREAGYVGDQRYVLLSYQRPLTSDPNRLYPPTTGEFDMSRGNVLDRVQPVIWPPQDVEPGYRLVWAAMTNRYFAAAVHEPVDPQNPQRVRLGSTFPTVSRSGWAVDGRGERQLMLRLQSAEIGLPAAGQQGAGRDLDLALFAGPKDPGILKEPGSVYSMLGMGDLIVYSLGGPCAFCTFAWLADLLMWFLSSIAAVALDWGFAIILLVAIVRFCLHPLTKGSQVNMMKVGKQMQAIQPEMERLKEKYKDNQQKLNQEMMNLYREKGVNPAAMGLGCLPMFLQMPIWIALYAVLYFAVELRHTQAFWGVFQKMTGGEWLFMADLAAQDHFIMFPAPLDLGFLTLESINLLPILMMVVFFLQQKYTTQPTAAQSEQAQMQQKMMKWTIMIIPLMLYKAPSGLTLYIMTSTAVGVVESYRVRKHLQELEAQGRLFEKKERKSGGIMDRLAKMAQQYQQQQQQGGGAVGPAGPGGGGGKNRSGTKRKKVRNRGKSPK